MNRIYRQLIIFLFALALCKICIAADPSFDLLGLSDVKDFVTSRSDSDRVNGYTYTTEPSLINIRYNRDRMYITATQCFTRGKYKLKGFFHENEDGNIVIEWFWDKIPFNIEDSGIAYFDYSFNCKASGKVIFQRSLNVQDNRDDIEFTEIPLNEGLDITFRMDGYWPKMFDPSCEWLYGKVENQQLKDEFAIEKFDGEILINGQTYHILKRCDSDYYNPNKAYEIAYMRFDGVSLWLLAPDVDLPLSIWNSSFCGTINPNKLLGNKEVRIMNLYNTDGFITFKDVPNNTIEMRAVLESDFIVDDFAQYWYDKFDITAITGYDWLIRLRLAGGINMIEGVATIGNCIHSLAYPSIVSNNTKGGLQKLIRVAGGWKTPRFTPTENEPLHTIYVDKYLYEAYKEITSSVSAINSELTQELSDQIYDLQGRQIVKPIKGEPYIQHGKIHIQK